jgi:hypothetical protein
MVCWRVASSQAHPRSPTFSLADHAASVTPRIAGGNEKTLTDVSPAGVVDGDASHAC